MPSYGLIGPESLTDAESGVLNTASIRVTDATSTALTGTLTAGHLTPVDATAGPATYSLPPASTVVAGGVTAVKKADAGVNTVTVQRAGSDVVYGTGGGGTSRAVTLPGESAVFTSNGVNAWTVLASDTPVAQLDARYNGTYAGKSDSDGAFYEPIASLTFTASASTAMPLSVGIDGLVYAAQAQGSTVSIRTGDAFATTSTGPNFSTLGSAAGLTLIYLNRVAEGYVAVLSAEVLAGSPGSNANLTAGAEIWFSTNWTSGWTKVQTAQRTQGLAISRPVVDPQTGSTVITVGEYSTTAGAVHNLWLSRNGGQTWTTIHSRVAVNGAQNNHYHGSGFDPIHRRIYVGHGDLQNAWFGYTPDFGSTWVDIAGVGANPPTSAVYHQPVVVQPMKNGVILDPDNTVGVSGVWGVDYDTHYVNVLLKGLGATGPSDQYAEAPVAVSGDVIYALFPMKGTRTSNTWYVAASGDGGRSWAKVYSTTQATTELLDRGIVGPDSGGKLYVFIRDDTNGNRLMVANVLSWTLRQAGSLKSVQADLKGILTSAGLLSSSGDLSIDLGTQATNVGSVNSKGTIKIGAGTGDVGILDTPTGTNALRLYQGGTRVLDVTNANIEFQDGKYIKFGTTTGTMIGSTTSQKLGFYGATPVARQTGTAAAATDLATAIALVNDLRAKLIALGLIS